MSAVRVSVLFTAGRPECEDLTLGDLFLPSMYKGGVLHLAVRLCPSLMQRLHLHWNSNQR